MAERPWHDNWIERDPNGPPPKRERSDPGSGWGWALLGGGALLRFAYDALWDRNRRWESNWDERQFETRQQNQAWKHREDAATARGRGRFANLHVDPSAEEFHQRAAERDYARGRRVLPEQSTATAPNTPPASSGRVGGRSAQEWAEFDARMRIREAATEAEMWADDPDGMARQARERSAATGEPLDPRAQRGLVRRGFAGVEPLKNPSAVEAGPGVDLEGMKRAKPAPAPGVGGGRVGGFVGGVGRAAPWAFVGWELYQFGRDWKEKGFTEAWKLRHPPPDAEGFDADTPEVVKQFVRANARKPAAPKPALPTFSSEEEGRAFYSNGEQDERAPSSVGGVPVDYVPTINPDAGRYAGAGGWGESAPKPKRGKPFADPYGIGQARLQAEHDIAEQNEAERRKQREEEQNQRKADNYIKYIETQDRKQARARAASEKREIEAENALFWGLQLDQWERERLERGSRRRHASINVNSWQAAGAVVGGFSQINVELVRSEIERALERGDTAIRMN